MKNIINNNCSNNTNTNTNNQINNNKSEVKTMKQLNVNSINKVINSENNSVIASTIGFAGIGNDGFLFNTINNIEQISAYLLLCEANNFEAPDNGIEGFARLSQIYFNTIEYRDFAGIGSVQQLREYDQVESKVEVTLTGWRIATFIDIDGTEYQVTPMSDEQLESVRTYAETYNEMQPANIRVSLEDIDAVIEDYRYNRNNFIYDICLASNTKQSICKDAAREFKPGQMITEPRAVVVSFPCCERDHVEYNPNDLGFVFDDGIDYNRVRAYLLVCELNGFTTPSNGGNGFARLAQVYYNTVPAKTLDVSSIDLCGCLLNPECYDEAYHFELNGWDIGSYIDDSGEVLPIKALTDDDFVQIGEYAKQINAMQPEAIRLSDDQIDEYVASKCSYTADEDDDFCLATSSKQSVRKDALREFNPAVMSDEPYAVIVSYPHDGRTELSYDPNDLCFAIDDLISYNRLNAFLLVCKLNGFTAPSNDDGFARLAQVYYNTTSNKRGCAGIEKCGYYLNPECFDDAYHFELKGWDIAYYVDASGEVMTVKPLTNEDLDQIGEYAKQINVMQPEAIRLSNDQIDAYIANAKLEG